MTIIVKSISDAKGGTGGTLYDDFKDIITNPAYGGFANIKKIDVKGITDIKSEDALESIRFVYNVVTKDGKTYEHQGTKRGGGLGQTSFDFVVNGGLTEIRGRSSGTVRYLMLKTPKQTLEYGKINPKEQEFVLPPGVIFGNSGLAVDSIGVYEIAEEEQLVKTVTSTITETISISAAQPEPETIFVDNPRTIIGLSIPLAVLSVLVLATLYYKYRNRDSLLRVAGSRGNGGVLYDDFKDIIGNSTKYGGFVNIKKIDVISITDIISGDLLESIRFVYNVVRKDGTLYEHRGAKRGQGVGGDVKTPFDFVAYGGLTEIRGRVGTFIVGKEPVIGYLMFTTPKRTLEYGRNNTLEQEFVLPPGVIFGNSGPTVNSIGVYEIVEEEQLVKTVTSTITETITATETTFVDNSRTVIGLSIPLAALSVLVVLTTLYYKYRNRNRDSILRVAGNGGTHYDDFKDIIANPTYGGFANIIKIDVKGITDIKSGDYLESIRFVYNIVTKNGMSYEYQGTKRGQGIRGVDQTPFDFVANGGLTEIRGKLDILMGGATVVKYLMFKTPQQTLGYGKDDPAKQEFVLPSGVIFGNIGTNVDSIGVYEIAEEEQLVKTVTSTIIETTTGSTSTVLSVTTVTPYAATETLFIDNPQTVIGLSIPLAALSVIILTTLYYKYRNRDSILGVAGSSQQ
nr:1546_t:CDS:2 [Entrophospora candida]